MSKHKIGKWYQESKLNFSFNVKKLEIAFFENLKKLGYGYFKVNKRSSKDKKIIRSFQQHYCPKNVTGKLDQKTFKISYFLTH